jgi:hypothetical protein
MVKTAAAVRAAGASRTPRWVLLGRAERLRRGAP